jgi:hypothetical protein
MEVVYGLRAAVSTIVTCRLPRDILDVLDCYATEHGGGSRSAAVEQILRRFLGVADPSLEDGQNRASGAEANAWGRTAAEVVAKKLGAEKEADEQANIYRLANGQRVLVKNARGKGDRVNVLPNFLGRFEVLCAGFWDQQGTQCDLFEVPADLFEKHAHEATRGKFLQIDRRTIERLGLRPNPILTTYTR